MLEEIKSFVERRPHWDGFLVHLSKRGPGHRGKLFIARKIVWEEIEEQSAASAYVSDPEIQFSETSAQMLIDALWDAGLRPSEGSGSAGSLRATEEHLKTVKSYADRLLAMAEKGK